VTENGFAAGQSPGATPTLSKWESINSRLLATKWRQVIAWGASPRMTFNRHVEPQSGDRCHGGIGNIQLLPPLRGSHVVVTTQSWGLRPRLSPVAASRLNLGNQMIPSYITRRSRNQSGDRWASVHLSTRRGRRADAHRSPKSCAVCAGFH
jgi:hypothetical protein